MQSKIEIKEMTSKIQKETRQKVQQMAGTEFNTKKNSTHYFNARTNG